MKKILFISVFSIVCMGMVCAQQLRFGISTGMEMSNYLINYSVTGMGYRSVGFKTGFQVSMEVDYSFYNNLYLMSGLSFTQRGRIERNTSTKKTDNINYLQLPVNLMYKLEMGENVSLCPFVGPYISWALSGVTKNHYNRNEDEKFIFGYESETCKPIDIGFNVGVSLEYLDFFLRTQYSQGFTNMLNGVSLSHKNMSTGISIGYLF
jgi:hypothetical protein